MSPSDKEVNQAEILEAMEQAKKDGKGAVSLDGRLIDIASIRQAEVLVEKAKLIKGDSSLANAKLLDFEKPLLDIQAKMEELRHLKDSSDNIANEL